MTRFRTLSGALVLVLPLAAHSQSVAELPSTAPIRSTLDSLGAAYLGADNSPGLAVAAYV